MCSAELESEQTGVGSEPHQSWWVIGRVVGEADQGQKKWGSRHISSATLYLHPR